MKLFFRICCLYDENEVIIQKVGVLAFTLIFCTLLRYEEAKERDFFPTKETNFTLSLLSALQQSEAWHSAHSTICA